MLRCPLSRPEERITPKIATGCGAARKRLRLTQVSSKRRAELQGASPSPSMDCLSPSIGFFPENRIWHTLDLFPLLLPSLLSFYGPRGRGREKGDWYLSNKNAVLQVLLLFDATGAKHYIPTAGFKIELPTDWLAEAEAKAGTGKGNIFIFRLKNCSEKKPKSESANLRTTSPSAAPRQSWK